MPTYDLISKVTIPNSGGTNVTYEIKDEWARNAISALGDVMEFIGVPTTPISDGSTTNPIVIDGVSVTAKKGDVVLQNNKEFVWDGTAWREFGDIGTISATDYTKVTVYSSNTSWDVGSGSSEVDITATGANVLPANATFTTTVTPTLKKLSTATVTGVTGSTTTHDTPTLNTTSYAVQSIDNFGTDATVGSASGWSAGSFPTLATSGSDNSSNVATATWNGGLSGALDTNDSENLIISYSNGNNISGTVSSATHTTYSLSGGSLPSLTVTNTTVATKGNTSTRVIGAPSTGDTVALGTSLTDGSSVTVPIADANATTVATGISNDAPGSGETGVATGITSVSTTASGTVAVMTDISHITLPQITSAESGSGHMHTIGQNS